MTQIPSHADQIMFLMRVQKILDEGQFVATYKFALLIALIDIAIERADDSGAPLEVDLEWLAAKFIELYWNHSKPFGGAVLSQNKGANIAVLGRIQALQTVTMSLAEARKAPQWRSTLRGIGQIIQAMPLFRLQLLRGDQRLLFLYEEELVNGSIRLKQGVAYCSRRFSTLIGALARNGWLREVRDNPRNAYAMGTRRALRPSCLVTNGCRWDASGTCSLPLQEGRCFYCGDRLTEAMHVDHFVPWTLYPSNLGHNFVLADARCNEDKSDLLADISHLYRWCNRERDYWPAARRSVHGARHPRRSRREPRDRPLGL